MTWTRFMDMHSGGVQKLDWAYVYIEAPEAEARAIFYNRFGRNPNRVTCTCCGEDYSISEEESLEEASAYDRDCRYDRELERYVEESAGKGYSKYRTVAEYEADENVLVVRAAEVTDVERAADIPSEGYVWAGG